MRKTIHFNTGRKYTANGQQITATLHDDGVVTFMDHSRGVDGEFLMGAIYLDHFDTRELKHEVLFQYDTGLAVSTTRSWQDGMAIGGCNSKFEG